jgi:hypothetical protein
MVDIRSRLGGAGRPPLPRHASAVKDAARAEIEDRAAGCRLGSEPRANAAERLRRHEKPRSIMALTTSAGWAGSDGARLQCPRVTRVASIVARAAVQKNLPTTGASDAATALRAITARAIREIDGPIAFLRCPHESADPSSGGQSDQAAAPGCLVSRETSPLADGFSSMTNGTGDRPSLLRPQPGSGSDMVFHAKQGDLWITRVDNEGP